MKSDRLLLGGIEAKKNCFLDLLTFNMALLMFYICFCFYPIERLDTFYESCEKPRCLNVAGGINNA